MKIGCCTRDERLGAALMDMLAGQGFECQLFPNEMALMRTLRHRGGIDLVLIDMTPEPTVEECILSWLAARVGDPVPVMLMSAYWSAQRMAMALDAGADDCIAKPCDSQELLARMKAVLRRCGAADVNRQRIEIAGFVLDRGRTTVHDRGMPVELTPREFSLAWVLFSSPDVRLSREAISLAIWGLEKDIASRTIEQHVYRLRKKLGLGPDRGVSIQATYGQGYRLELRDEPSRRRTTPGPALSRLAQLDAERNAKRLM